MVLIMRKKINKDKTWQVAFTDSNNKVLLVCGINEEGCFYSVSNSKKYKAFYTDYSNIEFNLIRQKSSTSKMWDEDGYGEFK